MRYLGFKEIVPVMLHGEWKVDHTLVTNYQNLTFSKAKSIEFEPTKFKAIDTEGKLIVGLWDFKEHSETIYNPQVDFEVGKSSIAKAIITKFIMVKRTVAEQIVEDWAMTLYFNSGLEIILNKRGSV